MEVTEAILLKAAPYNESQSILTLFSKQEGYISMITQAKSSKRRVLYPVMQSCEVEFLRNERGGLHKLVNLSPVDRASTLHFDIERSNYAQLWGNFLATLLRCQEKDESLYEYVESAVALLEESQEQYLNITLLFFVRLACFMGVKPNTDDYVKGMLLNVETGEFVAPEKRGSNMVFSGPNVAEAIYCLSVLSVEKAKGLRIGFKSFEIILKTIMSMYEHIFAVRFDRGGIEIILQVLDK